MESQFIKTTRVDKIILNWTPFSWSISSNNSIKLNSKYDFYGSLHLTINELIFHYNDVANITREIWIPYSNISSISLKLTSISLESGEGSSYCLNVSCKDFIHYRVLIPSMSDVQDVYDSVNSALSAQNTIQSLYAFFHHPSQKYERQSGWDFYDPIKEFERQGVGSDIGTAWRISHVNVGYNLCSTYPQVLAVPSKISDAVLFHAAKFRSKGRLPALSYFHKKTRASITRSSQPLVGIKAKRSIQDEKLIEAIFDSNFGFSGNTHNLIIDARPVGNALANRAMGAGTESVENYKNCDRLFMGIDNIHVMRESLNKLIEASFQSDSGIDRWYNALEGSSWLKHIRNIMESSVLIVEALDTHSQNVLIHCSDGWDRTAQLASVASLCLDPYYRTLEGLQTLIEREWLSFGHKFSDRCGHIRHLKQKNSSTSQQTGSKEEKETSPVFLQFLEVAWNITNQFPAEFEFNATFLIDLYRFSMNCKFGTFLGNCERERLENDLKNKTYSVWAHIKENRWKYVSNAYNGSDRVLYPSFCPKNISFWAEMYSSWDLGVFGFDVANNYSNSSCNSLSQLLNNLNLQKFDLQQKLKLLRLNKDKV